jgi:hypothetical protein
MTGDAAPDTLDDLLTLTEEEEQGFLAAIEQADAGPAVTLQQALARIGSPEVTEPPHA